MKGLRLIDRLSGRDWVNVRKMSLAGTVLLRCDEPVWLNGLRIDQTAYLIPLPNGKINLMSTQEEEIAFSDWDAHLFPVRHEKSSYLVFGSQLGELIELGAGFHDWLDVSPWVIQSFKKVQLNRFDRMLERYLWHLEEVGRRPHSRLTIEIERMPVGRARRIPPKAYSYLASHTEDWEYRKLTSVVPSRILSTLPDELLNFYENRLAARLIFDSFRYLRNRLHELIAIERGLEEASPELGTHQRQQRVYRLMGEAIDLGQLQNHTRTARQFVEGLYARTVVLFESQLFKAITAQERDQVPDGVRNTNILVNDRHYRFVNLLWKEYLLQNSRRPKTRREITHEQQELCQGFHSFCVLLVCHALHELGFSTEDTNPLANNSTSLISRWGTIELSWEMDQAIVIKQNGQTLARLVPIISTLAATPNKTVERLAEIASILTDVGKKTDRIAAEKGRPYTIVLYPGQSSEIALLDNTQRQAVTTGVDLPQPQSFGVLPVSSYLPGSVERVGRAIRWAIWRSQFEAYPPEISLPTINENEILTGRSTWLHSTGKHGAAYLLRQPDDRKEAYPFREYLRQKRSELQSQGAKVHQKNLERILECELSFDAANANLAALSTCPLCRQPARPEDFLPRDQGSFVCNCRNSDCRDAQWGLRICGDCGQKYPFLIQSGEGLRLPNQPGAGWLDDIFGMDVLAAPCPATPQKWEFRCPHCGACPNVHTPVACQACRASQQEKHR